MRNRKDITYKILLCIILLASLLVMLFSMRDDSPTSDEPVHLLSGYLALKDRDFSLDPEHPFLSKMINALPLLFLKPEVDYSHTFFSTRNNFYYDARREGFDLADKFVFKDNDVRTLIFWGRLPSVLATLGLIICVYIFGSKIFGQFGALVSTGIIAFQPNILAHGRMIGTDIWLTLTFFIASFCIYLFAQKPSLKYAVLMGLSAGAALVCKFSAIFLVPIILTVLIYGTVHQKVSARLWVITMACSLGVIWAANGFLIGTPIEALNHVGSPEPYFVPTFPRFFTVFVPYFWKGLFLVLREPFTGGRPYFFLGHYNFQGFFGYFPVAWLLKTPIAEIIAFPVALLYLYKCKFADNKYINWLFISPIVFFIVAIISRFNIGIRHILIIEPFTALIIGFAAAIYFKNKKITFAKMGLAVCLAIFYLSAFMRIYPYYIAYFNEFVGPKNGYKYISDSNIDWGQDAFRLRKYLTNNNINRIVLDYHWSWSAISYVGINAEPFNGHNFKGNVIAIDVSDLIPNYFAKEDFSWLQKVEPTARIGYSIYVYDFRSL